MAELSEFTERVATVQASCLEFDRGHLHDMVRAVTGVADVFPGRWAEVWWFDYGSQMWVVDIYKEKPGA